MTDKQFRATVTVSMGLLVFAFWATVVYHITKWFIYADFTL